MRPARYEIHVDGVMPADDLDELVGMTATDDGSSTVLRCLIPDQPTLVGVLARVEASGCTVRELRLVGPPDPVGAGPARSAGSAWSARPSRSWWRPTVTAAPGGGRRSAGSASAAG